MSDTESIPLTEEQLDKWLKELRSGQYKQGRFCEFNRERGEVCAMGVLGSILFGTENSVHSGVGAGWRRTWPKLSFVGKDLQFQDEVTGMGTANLYYAITWLNDFLEKDFSQVADWLEERRAEILKF